MTSLTIGGAYTPRMWQQVNRIIICVFNLGLKQSDVNNLLRRVVKNKDCKKIAFGLYERGFPTVSQVFES